MRYTPRAALRSTSASSIETSFVPSAVSGTGARSVSFEVGRNGLSIEYDPSIIDNAKLIEIMCRYGVYPEPISPRPNGPRGDG